MKYSIHPEVISCINVINFYNLFSDRSIRVDVEMGELPLFYFLYSSITFTLCEGKVRFPCFITFWILSLSIELAMQDSHPTLYCTKTWYHLSMCQKMLTALFNLVWNTQKSKWTIFFECPTGARQDRFLNIEKV